MATISRVQDLLPLLGAVETDDDPIASLEQRGHVLSPALKTRLKPGRVFSPAQRKLWKETAAKAGAVRITVGEQPRIAPRQLAPDEYEFSAGIRMPAANEILAGVHANGTIPEVLFLDELISPGNIDTLQRFFAVDKPGGRIGRFLITAPPTIAPIREGSNSVAFTIPFRMNFERIATAGSNQVRTVVTFATGRLRLSIRLVAETDTDSRGARNLEMRLALSHGDDARLGKETHPDAGIDSADVAFRKDTIQLIASGRIVDLCPGGVDVGFTVTTTLTITLDGTRIEIGRASCRERGEIS